MPRGWKDRYGADLDQRPFVKVCAALPLYVRENAVEAFREEQAREAGVIWRAVRMTPDGGHVLADVDAGGED